MASFGHIAIGMAGGRAFVGRGAEKKQARRAMIAFSILSLWPDADYAGMVAGIPYEHQFGHRGATHSLFVAIALAGLAFVLSKRWGFPPLKTAVITLLVAASHGVADAMTFGGGLGCALFWPLEVTRIWMPGPEPGPLRFIPIAPLGLYMFSVRGLLTVLVELIIFSPFVIYATLPARGAKKA